LYRFLETHVAEYMTASVDTVTRDITMRELQARFERDDYNAYPVVENQHVVGLVTKFDFLECFAFQPSHMVPRYADLMNRTVADVMTPDFIYVHRDTRLTRVLQLMVEHHMRSIPVIDGARKLAGIVSREDIMRALADCTRDEPREPSDN
jgi:CBS domain-containing protein